MLYFDHNATSPLIPAAQKAWLEANERWIGNPSSQHRLGARASTALEEARARLASILGCDPLDLLWTCGATESNNHAIQHLAAVLPRDRWLWISAIEHPCLIEPAERAFAGRLRRLPVTPEGVVDLAQLESLLATEPLPGAIACLAANNETGAVQPWSRILGWCRERGIPFLCDAVQWLGKQPAEGLGACDFLTGSAHKFGGPRGVGFLKVPRKGPLHPFLVGGPQEEGRRAGTENVAGALSLVAALESREALLKDSGWLLTRERWQSRYEQRLTRELPGLKIVSAQAPRLWNTVTMIMPEADCRQRWVVRLDRQGCAVSTGSACSSGKEEPSHVLRAMGIDEREAGRVLRFSSGWETTSEEWDQLAEFVISVVRSAEAASA